MLKNTIITLILFSSIVNSGTGPTNPIMFVTQYPVIADFTTIGSTFGNHSATMQSTGRGGDLYIRYVDGTLRNLTREAGFGNSGFQGNNAIAVRDPTIHWSGTKALFSMVIGAPEQFDYNDYYWQMYEITGFGQGQTVQITKVANQAEDYNNITPIYSSDGHIIFTSDMPRTKNRFNYPQYDEYESASTNTGLWKLNTISGLSSLLQHSPSGSFTPMIDSAGRIVFTRWDHLQRDQQASPNNNIGAFNYTNENPGATPIDTVLEIFPEPRTEEVDLLAGTNMEGLRFNHFFPWQLNQDGTEEETVNHVGRHEFHDYFNRSINDDSNVIEFIDANSGRANQNEIENTFHLNEDPNQAGRFLAIDAPEFGTHSGGQIIAFSLPKGDLRPDLVTVDYLSNRSTRNTDDTPPPEHVGFFRDPLTLTNTTVVSSHTSETRANGNEGTFTNPIPRYMFQLKTLTANVSGDLIPDSRLTTLADVNISFFSPDSLITYNGPLWELQAVEVVSKPTPPMTNAELQAPEQQIFAEENVDETLFKSYLTSYNLAVVVMRDITTRDAADEQQPYNLKVAGSSHQTIGSAGQIYDISHMQFVQADQIRGSGGIVNPNPGQRVIAQYLHDQNAVANNIPFVNAPTGSAEIYDDGSAAFFVPARRAMAWQSLAPNGTPVVRERYWITFQPGEIRACGGCHGVNNTDQSGGLPSLQKAEAFRALLQHWKANFVDLIFESSFESPL
jgi:hypothetical protein